jgi:hypothetical protein
MVYFQTKNPNLGNFWEGPAMEDIGIFYGHLVCFVDIWSILWAFGLFYGHLVYLHLVYFIDIWSILQPFGKLLW